MKLYYALIYPFLTYGILIWWNTYETTLKPLFILQKKAVRIITFSKLDSCSSPLFKSLGLIKFFDIALFQIAIFMYKFHKNVLPASFHSFFYQGNKVFIIVILDLQQNTLTVFLMLEPIKANWISVFKVHLCGILLMIM